MIFRTEQYQLLWLQMLTHVFSWTRSFPAAGRSARPGWGDVDVPVYELWLWLAMGPVMGPVIAAWCRYALSFFPERCDIPYLLRLIYTTLVPANTFILYLLLIYYLFIRFVCRSILQPLRWKLNGERLRSPSSPVPKAKDPVAWITQQFSYRHARRAARFPGRETWKI
jgi:hypothetical protein